VVSTVIFMAGSLLRGAVASGRPDYASGNDRIAACRTPQPSCGGILTAAQSLSVLASMPWTWVPVLSVTPRIALASVALGPLQADPADRLIAATALAYGAALVTKDERLHAVAGLASLW
jgi:predicted nucleic acid-binding protein